MKKLINDVENVVKDSLAGMQLAYGDLVEVDLEHKLVFRKNGSQTDKVGLVSGGGSGHEPLHGGFVGLGMLDAACCGQIFTSPVPDQIELATRKVNKGKGVLHIVKNYTGDVMNFDMAAELVQDDGIEIEAVITADDVAVKDSLYTAGRRGVGITVLLEKIAGAAAEEGRNLTQVADIAKQVNDNGRSLGIALSSCTVPAAGKPTFSLAENEIEFGIGIHGEPGSKRMELLPVHDLVPQMLEPILADIDFTKTPILCFVNGMGGTPLMEQYIVYGEVARQLAHRGIKIARSLVGNYISSLEMAGVSITLLRLNDELLKLWDAPVLTPGIRWGV